MPKLPDPRTAAGQASYGSVQRVISAGEMDMSGAFKGQAAMGKALQQTGEVVTKIGAEEKKRKDTLELMDNDAAMDAEARALKRKYDNDDDPATAPTRFAAEYAALRQRRASSFSDPYVAREWNARWEGRGNAALDGMHDWAKKKEKEKFNADFITSSQKVYNYAGTEGTTAEDVADLWRNQEETINEAVRQGTVPADVGTKAIMEGRKKLRELHFEKKYRFDPKGGSDDVKFLREMRKKIKTTGPIPVPDVDVKVKQPPLKRTVGVPREGRINGIAIHQTWGSDTMDGNGSWSNKTNTGANYYIDKNGEVYAWAPDEVRMNHIGKGRNGSRPDLTNDSAIGIEIMTRPNERPNPKQIAAARSLSLSLADKYGFDPSKDVVGHGEITRSSHRRPDEAIEVVKAIREGTMAEGGPSGGEGRPVPVAKRGLTQYAGLKSDTMTDAAAEPESDVSPEDMDRFNRLNSLYGDMSDLDLANLEDEYRREAIKRDTTALQNMHDALNSDVQLRMKGQSNPELDQDRIESMKAAGLEGSVIGRYQIEAKRADAYWAAKTGQRLYYGEKLKIGNGKPLSDLSNAELDARVNEVSGTTVDGDNAVNKNWVASQINKEVNNIKELRRTDLAAASDQSEHVRDVAALQQSAATAQSGMAPGETVDVSGLMGQDMTAIVKARMEHQASIGVPETSRRAITKAEAMSILPDDFSKIEGKDVKAALEAGAARAQQMYGPYASQALDDAIDYRIKNAEKASAGGRLVKKLAEGKEITKGDMRDFASYQAASLSDGFMAAPTADYLEPRPAISPWNNEVMNKQIANLSESAMRSGPNVALIDWAKLDPARRGPVVDSIFGQGTFAKTQANNQGNP